MDHIFTKFRPSNQKWSTLLVWVAIHLFLLFLFFRLDLFSRLPLIKEDVALYKHYADGIIAGHQPYKDFVPEYPPLALAVFAIPKLFAHTEAGYRAAFFLLMLGFEFLSLLVILRMERSNIGKTALLLSPGRSSFVFFLYVLAIGHLVYFRFDIVASFSILMAVYFGIQNRGLLSWVFLAIAVGVKGFALFLVPLFMIYSHFKSGARWKGEAVIGFGGASLLVWAPFLLIDHYGVIKSFFLHVGRGIEIGSTYASLFFIGRLVGLSVSTVFGQNSVEVVAPGSASMALYSIAILILLFTFVYVRFFRSMKLDYSMSEANLVKYTTLSILGFMLTFKVFSPQFMVWVGATAPLVSLGSKKRAVGFWAGLLLSAVLTQVIIFGFFRLAVLSPLFLALQVLRNALLVALFLAMFFSPSLMKDGPKVGTGAGLLRQSL